MKEHCDRCSIPTGMSHPPSFVCWSTCPCHSTPSSSWEEKFDRDFGEFFEKYDNEEWYAKGQIKLWIEDLLQERTEEIIGTLATRHASLKKNCEKHPDGKGRCGVCWENKIRRQTVSDAIESIKKRYL